MNSNNMDNLRDTMALIRAGQIQTAILKDDGQRGIMSLAGTLKAFADACRLNGLTEAFTRHQLSSFVLLWAKTTADSLTRGLTTLPFIPYAADAIAELSVSLCSRLAKLPANALAQAAENRGLWPVAVKPGGMVPSDGPLEFKAAGAKVDIANLTKDDGSPLRKEDGSPIKDLNDCTSIHPDDAAELEGLLP